MISKLAMTVLSAPVLILTFCSNDVYSQLRSGAAAGPPPTAKAAAPVDLTGYWVALVTEDWRYRMALPPKGDYSGIPMNADARKVADSWDPAKAQEPGEQCRAYGAAGLIRMPTRLHITWSDDETMRVEFDAGTQTRMFHFKPTEGKGG